LCHQHSESYLAPFSTLHLPFVRKSRVSRNFWKNIGYLRGSRKLTFRSAGFRRLCATASRFRLTISSHTRRSAPCSTDDCFGSDIYAYLERAIASIDRGSRTLERADRSHVNPNTELITRPDLVIAVFSNVPRDFSSTVELGPPISSELLDDSRTTCILEITPARLTLDFAAVGNIQRRPRPDPDARYEYKKALAGSPRGIWLPEFAYLSGLKTICKAALGWFFHGCPRSDVR